MEFDHESPVVPIGSILYGTLVAMVVNLILTIILAILTEFGWLAVVKPYSNNLYLVIGYLAVVAGSIMAGRECSTRGWLTGLGVGMLSSLVLMVLTAMIGHPVVWGIFLAKMVINGFVGLFGGIIGINLAGSQK